MLSTNVFVHGGPGWIISRALCEKIHQEILNYNSKQEIGDDVIMLQIVSKYITDINKIHSSAFVGPKLNKNSEKLIQDWEFKDPPQCKSDILTKINNIAVWHCGNRDLEPLLYGNNIISEGSRFWALEKWGSNEANICTN